MANFTSIVGGSVVNNTTTGNGNGEHVAQVIVTESAYANIPIKDPNTLYFITEN